MVAPVSPIACSWLATSIGSPQKSAISGKLHPHLPAPDLPVQRVYFINRFYWPDETATAQLLTDLAESLAARGFDVHIVTSRSSDEKVPHLETRRGVTIHRVSRQGRPKALAFLRFAWRALWFLFHTPKSDDTVVLLTDPPLLNLPATLIAQVRGLRTLHWIQDIYPEIAVALTPHRWLGFARPLRNLALRQSPAIVTLGTAMAGYLQAQTISADRIHCSPNWCPARLPAPSPDEIEQLRSAWGLADKMIVAYSGNLGRVHALEPVIDLAAQLRLEHRIAFVFIGNGAQRHALQTRARQLDLENVFFFPPQPREALAATLAAADVHLITLHEDCADFVFPSKLYGIAQAGRPMLFVGAPASEVAQLIRAAEMGSAFGNDELAIMSDTLRTWLHDPALRASLAENAARFSQGSPSLENASALWASLLASAQPPPR